jgi:hypothetical protein
VSMGSRAVYVRKWMLMMTMRCVCCIAQREMDDVCVRERGRRR